MFAAILLKLTARRRLRRGGEPAVSGTSTGGRVSTKPFKRRAASSKSASKKPAAPAAGPPRLHATWLQLLKRPLALRLRGRRLQLVVHPVEGLAVENSPGLLQLPEGELALMRSELKALLDRHQNARRVLRYLAFVERALKADGALMFERAPVRPLRVALAQLESLVRDWSPSGLAALRSHLATALIRRQREEASEDAASTPVPVLSEFGLGDRVEVADASLSVFDAAAANWANSHARRTRAAQKGPP